ncbi:MAG: hypothetical protein KAI73_03080 [Rhodospirillaceae bacterium]|nr:hypothetical protein [Rhodospirillaceae bacterium]
MLCAAIAVLGTTACSSGGALSELGEMGKNIIPAVERAISDPPPDNGGTGVLGAPPTRWDVYYANLNQPIAEVAVLDPLGTSRPMGRLLANSVVEHLERAGLGATLGPQAGARHFVLSGTAEVNRDRPEVRYVVLIRWLLSDANGRVIGSHTQGVEGSKRDWDLGSPKLLRSVGVGIAEPIAALVRAEMVAPAPADPVSHGVLMTQIQGLGDADGQALMAAMTDALRQADISIGDDPRQANYMLSGHVEHVPAQTLGREMVRITWKVAVMDGAEIGTAVQEQEVAFGSMEGRWDTTSPQIAAAAAKGISRIFADISRNPVAELPLGSPPDINLPAVPGRAPPPPP